MNIFLAHASGGPIRTTMGSQRVDFHEVIQVAQIGGATAIYFPRMERLAYNNLADAVRQTHPGVGPYKLRQFVGKAKGLLEELLEEMELEDPPSPKEEIDAARRLFQENQRDLSGLVSGRRKDPIPEDEDLEIMVKASGLEAETVYLLSMDAHFVGYADLLEERWGFQVVDPRDRPMIAQEWRRG